MLKKLFKLLSSRLFWFVLMMAVQFVLLIAAVVYASNNTYVFIFFFALTLVMALFIVTRDESTDYKNAWLLILIVFPLVGAVLYLIFGNKKLGRRGRRKLLNTRPLRAFEADRLELDDDLDSSIARQMSYIKRMTGFNAWKGNEVHYYPYGDDFVEDALSEIAKAERFIFIEYFILAPGKVWDRVLDALEAKSKEGVIVRILYDDLGSINVLSVGYHKMLRSRGLEAHVFNPVAFHMNPRLNYRDHRKILDIDGNVCFTGGLNLADEYTNDEIRFAYWKDNAIKIKGPVVWNFTQLFLTTWNALEHSHEDMGLYRPTLPPLPSSGYVQAFGDSPVEDEEVARNVYIQAVNNAKRYVWIVTPYLVLDSEMASALSLAAGSGVDVRIVTPAIPDKKTVHEVTRSMYAKLVAEGVRIYEFAPGFIHAKTLVSDDSLAIVGTANLDYRSFYLHFELSVLFTGADVVKAVKDDTIYAMERGDEQDLEKLGDVSLVTRIVRTFLGFFAPAL